jgi:2,3-bisphosphoglycerate-dependent phosphoglycerate mutase
MPTRQICTPATGSVVDLILIRHGRSTANELGIYCGWNDAPLCATGREQVHRAGQRLHIDGTTVDVVHTSLLSRARESTELLLQSWRHPEATVHADWRLNERHLGLLQGLTREEVIGRWGNAARQAWRSDPTATPPGFRLDDPGHPVHDGRYRHVPAHLLPGAESIEEMSSRVLDYWYESIRPDLDAGRNVAVVAHRDTIRAIIGHLDGCGHTELADLAIPTARPIRYRVDPVHFYGPTPAALQPAGARELLTSPVPSGKKSVTGSGCRPWWPKPTWLLSVPDVGR